MTPPVALTIAGSDASGGAGAQADLRTFAALGVHGASAFAALTAQNTLGVRAVHPVPADFLVAQVEAVLDDLAVRAVKTGMLATAANVTAVAGLAAAGRLPHLVVDPVMVSSTGDRLLDPDAERAYLAELLPYAAVLTPNLREAQALLGAPIGSLDEQRAAARALGGLGPRVVVVKGGHPPGGGRPREAVDVVWADGELTELRGPWVHTRNDHGTGCTFASAVAAGLARGQRTGEALRSAKAYVGRAIAGGAGWRLGGGHGPLDHFGWSAAAGGATGGAGGATGGAGGG